MWHKTELTARQANGRGDVALAIKLYAQSIDEARDPNLHWSELQSALASAALFHEFVTQNFQVALKLYRESEAILNEHLGADSREARNFAECVAHCEAEANSGGG